MPGVCWPPLRNYRREARALRHTLAGYWSRRIDDEHRLVYKIEGAAVLIAQAQYHY